MASSTAKKFVPPDPPDLQDRPRIIPALRFFAPARVRWYTDDAMPITYPRFGSFYRSSFLAASLLAPALLGCAASPGQAPPSTTTITAPTIPAAPSRGGVRYDSLPPITAVITPRFPADNPPKSALTYHISYTSATGAVVPGILMVPAQNTVKAPTVILLHGVGGKKEDILLLAYAMSMRGYVTLLIDIPGHGERPKINNRQVFELTLPEMRQMAGQTVADLRRGVDFLATRPEVDPNRVGFVGISLGGILGAVFAADEPRVKATALWSAGGNWGRLLTTSTHDFAQKFRKKGTPTAQSVTEIMADVDPLPLAASIAPRPLLLLTGDKDTVVPIICSDELFAAAREPKKRVVIPGGHVPNPSEMAKETLAFLEANLKASAPAAK